MASRSKQILVSAEPNELKVAVLEQGRLCEIYVERKGRRPLAGNIYKGKVENVLPGMEAAFVDIGLEKNGFLYVEEVMVHEDPDKRPKKITQMLRSGQEILVQIVKDPMGTKGARLTTSLSIPGRFMVYVPGGDGAGVSRRLPDEERQRLRQLCKELKIKGAGLIVRTAAEGVTKKELLNDVKFLEKMWQTVQGRDKGSKAPALLYSEAEVSLKVIRDIFNDTFERILVDSQKEYDKIRSFIKKTSPKLAERVEMYQGSKPLMETYGVDAEIKQALLRRVDLPSGGYLIIEFTEALTIIDVNTGRYVGRTRLEDTIVKTNIEACKEVVRQLRLRDIGGIIIIDFIDMARPRNRQQVLDTLGKELETDRTKTYIVELSPLGLVEMTRQNVTDGLRGILTKTCPTCNGEGVILSEESMAFDIERRLRRLAETSSNEAFLVEVHPKVAAMLIGQGGAKLKEIEEETKKYFSFEGLDTISIDTFNVSAEGSREAIQRASLPVAEGDEVRLRIEEPHMYNTNDGIARIDGYVISISGAGKLVGQDKKVHIDSVSRTCAYGKVVEEIASQTEPEAAASAAGSEDVDVPKRQDWRIGREDRD
ncbi:MAG: Rne/Rng family ribonuclease [Thermoleophilia bacterium]|nr:Rne/Rng family ribonuclease [Thermoleophilia bacterium]